MQSQMPKQTVTRRFTQRFTRKAEEPVIKEPSPKPVEKKSLFKRSEIRIDFNENYKSLFEDDEETFDELNKRNLKSTTVTQVYQEYQVLKTNKNAQS